MTPNEDHETVQEIRRRKRGLIKDAALEPGSPTWDDILDLAWEEVVARAKAREPGFRTFKKLLGKSEYDK